MLVQEQIDRFHRDGFLVIPQLFSGKELELLRQAAQRVQQEGGARLGSGHLYHTDGDGAQVYFRSERMWDRDPIFRAVTVNPDLLSAVGQCIGHSFFPFNNAFVCKLPNGNVPVLWHQDPPYWSKPPLTPQYTSVWELESTFEIPNFVADIYLDHSTVDNGCVWGLPEHHLVGHVQLNRLNEDRLFESHGTVALEMEPGDVLFHALSAPHGSRGNLTDTTRRVVYLQYVNMEVFYHGYSDWQFHSQRSLGANGQNLIREMMDSRRDLGLQGVEGYPLRQTDNGWEFLGKPSTPVKHWKSLIEQMSDQEIKQKKQLESLI